MMILQEVDIDILLWIQEHLRVDVLTPFWKVITFLGNGGWFWLVAGSCDYWCAKKTRLRRELRHYFRIAVGFLHHECAAEEYCCPPKTF